MSCHNPYKPLFDARSPISLLLANGQYEDCWKAETITGGNGIALSNNDSGSRTLYTHTLLLFSQSESPNKPTLPLSQF